MDVIDRINVLLSQRGIAGAELSRELGFSNGAYSQWNTKKTKPSKRSIKLIADFFGVSAEYLTNGLKDMTMSSCKRTPTIPTEEGYIHVLRGLISYHERMTMGADPERDFYLETLRYALTAVQEKIKRKERRPQWQNTP